MTLRAAHTGFYEGPELPASDFFSRNGQVLLFKKNIPVYEQDNLPVGLYRIIKGRVRLCRHIEGGQRQIFQFCREGDFLGLAELLSQTPYALQAETLEPAEILFIPLEKMIAGLQQSNLLVRYLLEEQARTQAVWMSKIANTARKSVRARLALSLLDLHHFFLIPPNATAVIVLSRTDLADYAGTTVETTVRMLRELKENGLVHLRGRRIMVLDLPGLQHLG